MKIFLKPVWTMFSLAVLTVIFGTSIIFMAFISKTGKIPYFIGCAWARFSIKINGIKIKLNGFESIVKQCSYVYISNHCSNLDPLAVANAIPQTLRFIAKKSLFQIPVFGWAVKMAGMISIDRHSSGKAINSINKIIGEIRNGISVFFFAEGTRSTTGKLLPFKKGGFMFAIKAGIPIIPVTIINSCALLPKGKFYIKAGLIKVIAGNPVSTTHYNEHNLDKLISKVSGVIENNLICHKEF